MPPCRWKRWRAAGWCWRSRRRDEAGRGTPALVGNKRSLPSQRIARRMILWRVHHDWTVDSLLKSYGLHWHNEKVFWGRPKVAGTLLGAASKSKSAKPINFRLQRGIYALYANYELVYVGQTGSGDDRLFARLRTHNRDHLSERWNRFSWFGTQRVTKKGILSADTANLHVDVGQGLNILEAVATAISEPRLNLQRGKWSEATQYYQYLPNQEDEED